MSQVHGSVVSWAEGTHINDGTLCKYLVINVWGKLDLKEEVEHQHFEVALQLS